MAPENDTDKEIPQDSNSAFDVYKQVNNSHKKKRTGFIGYLSDKLLEFIKLITNGLVLLILLIIIRNVFIELRKPSIIIEPYEVTKDMEKENYTSKMLANGLIDEINKIYYKAEINQKQSDIMGSWIGEQAQFKLPGSNISISSLISFIKKQIGIKENHITGEAIKINDIIYITTRISESQSIHIKMPFSNTSSLFKTSAEYIVKNTDPIVLAFYYYYNNKPLCSEIIDDIILNGLKADKASAYLIKGMLFNDERKYDTAIRCWQKSIELNPKQNAAYIFSGLLLFHQGDFKGAIDKYQKASELDPKFSLPIYMCGFALERQGELNGAIDKYKKAINIDPKDVTPYGYWGRVLDMQGDVKSAIAKFQMGIDIDPKNDQLYEIWGDVLDKHGEINNAIIKYQNAIVINPNNKRVYYKLENILKRQGNIKAKDALLKKE